MNPEEYAHLDRLDQVHWFYRGKRAIVRHWIDRYRPLGPDDLLIDAGMGTGTWLVEMANATGCRVLGLDAHNESLAIAGPRLATVGGQAVKTELTHVGLPDAIASVVTALDVIEHLDDDDAAVDEMIRLTRPGGLIVLTVPALRWLWSDWDVVLHHRRRYQKPDLLRLVHRPGVDVLRCAYFNSLLLPAIGTVRLWRKIAPATPGAPRAEDHVPIRPINTLLEAAFVRPACWSWFQPPAGSSLLAVLRRTGPTESTTAGFEAHKAQSPQPTRQNRQQR